MTAPAPIYRGQGNTPFRSEPRTQALKRGQTVDYGSNGAPPPVTSADITDFAEAVDDRVGALLVPGTNVTLTYNDGANQLTIDAATGSATWGAITGTLSSQADLQTALDGKLSIIDGAGAWTGYKIAQGNGGGVAFHDTGTDAYAGVFVDEAVGSIYLQDSAGAAYVSIGGAPNGNSRFRIDGSNAFEFTVTPYVGTNAVLTAASSLDAAKLTGTIAVARLPAMSGGDVTSLAGSAVLTIGANKVTRGMLAATAGATILGATGAGNVADLTPAQAKTFLAITESDVASLTTDLAAKAPLASPQFTGVAFYQQSAPTAKNATATLTIADLLTLIITTTSTTAVSLTLPTGTLTDAGILSGALAANEAFEWYLINLGSSSGAVTLLAGSGHTIVGNAVVAISTSARFLTRKTAANTFVTYRIA